MLAAEDPDLRVYWVDPGDMRTQMHQDAFPGEDISDRPPPEESVPGLVALIEGDRPSGRYQARALAGRGSRRMSTPGPARRSSSRPSSRRPRRPRSAAWPATASA